MRGHSIKGGSAARFLLTMRLAAGIALCSVILSLVSPLQADLTLASSQSVNTLPATGISGTAATLHGEMTALGGPRFVALSAGFNHSLGVRSDGTLWAWGHNAYGQLGLGDTIARLIPTRVGSATNWVAVSAGHNHSLGLCSDGTLWAWGINDDGELGLGDTIDKLIPTRVGSASNWVVVSAGACHSLALRSDGTLWAWGRNRSLDVSNGGGQLGVGDRTDRHVPTPVGSATNWVAVSGGLSHSLGVRSDGTLWAWGWNPHHELGLGDTPEAGENIPTQVGSATNWVGVSAVTYHSLGVRSDGTLWGWGSNGDAQLGLGYPSGDVYIPSQAGVAANWMAVDGQASYSLGVRSDGTLWIWGGIPPYRALNPIQVGSATNWMAVSPGGTHFLGLRSDGTLWAWIGNEYGQLGQGDTTNRDNPTQVILDSTSWQVSFEWGPTSSYGYETAAQTLAGGGTFSADISGLTPLATYHFRARVVGDVTIYGDDMTFEAIIAPSVTTNAAGSITTSSARLNGALDSLGTAGSVTVSFAWGTSSGSYPHDTTGQAMTSTGTFYYDLANLEPGRTYYCKAKAVGHGEAVYGVEKSFTTGQSPVVEGVDPPSGRRGQHLTVTISGANFTEVADVGFGSGIAVEDLYVSSTVITAEIAIESDAEVGARDVSVATAMGTATKTGGFTVTSDSSLPIWVYPVAVVGGLIALMILLAVGARLVRRFAT